MKLDENSDTKIKILNCVSIGTYRDDGSFAILATLNNNDERFLGSGEFEAMCESVRLMCQGSLIDDDVIILERQDTPDYVDVEE